MARRAGSCSHTSVTRRRARRSCEIRSPSSANSAGAPTCSPTTVTWLRFRDACHLESRRFRPIGDTDSEFAFCCLLQRLAPLWDPVEDTVPSVESRLEIVAEFAAHLRPLGSFNFIYADSDALFVHSHHRKYDDGITRSPGLNLLVRSCNEQAIDLTQSGVMMAPVAQELVLVASVPLTDEPWEPIQEGEVVALTKGMVWARQLPNSGL